MVPGTARADPVDYGPARLTVCVRRDRTLYYKIHVPRTEPTLFGDATRWLCVLVTSDPVRVVQEYSKILERSGKEQGSVT